MKIVLAILCLLLTSACAPGAHIDGRGRVHSGGGVGVPGVAKVKVNPSGAKVIVPGGHIHSDGCGHYMFHDEWYELGGHMHAPGCGHLKVKGFWVLPD